MLPPERVKYPRSAEIFRKNDKKFEKKIDTLVQNYKEYLSEYLKEKEQRLKGKNFFFMCLNFFM